MISDLEFIKKEEWNFSFIENKTYILKILQMKCGKRL
jgi:hypothetical protein